MAPPTTGTAIGASTDTRTDSPGRTRILEVAAGLFLDHGYEAASLRRIAEDVGIQAASIYHHFESKEDLLATILRRGMAVMDDAFDRAAGWVDDHDADPRTRLAAHVRAHLAALYENGPFTAVHVTTFRTAPDEVRAAIVPVRDAYEARWTDLLHSLVDAGHLAADTDVGVARVLLLGGMNATVGRFDPAFGSLDHLTAVAVRQFWDGHALDDGYGRGTPT